MADNLTFNALTGAQKAAIFLLAMGETYIKKIFSQMDDEEVREISIAMASLGIIEAHLVEQVLKAFTQNMKAPSTLVGTFEGTEKLLAKVLPAARHKNILNEIRGPAGRTMWDKLENVNEEVLAHYLQNEYPQTVAVIISRLSAEHAAKVLAYLPENFVMAVIMRLLRLETVQKDVLDSIEQTLKTDFMTGLTNQDVQDSTVRVAEIFNHLDRTTENRLMTGLFERNREVAEHIRSLMFTFEDLIRLDDKTIQTVLRAVDRGKIALALKGASEQVKSVIFKNMSERAKQMLTDDMEYLGPVRAKEVQEAQTGIVNAIRNLEATGEITITRASVEDELIE